MPLSNEQELICAAQRGDKDAFEALVLHYRAAVQRFAASYLHNSYDAEDIAQEAFARVYLRLDTFRPGTSFKSWLFTIVRNLCIDHIRGQKPGFSLEETILAGEDASPAARLEQQETMQQAIALIDAFKPDTRTMLYLSSVEALPHKEIARIMGKTPVQVRVTLHRARQKLRQQRRHTDE